MKKNAGKQFLKSFLKSFGIIAVLSVIGVVSYRVAVYFLNVPATQTVKAEKGQDTETITEPSIDEISKNLIYCTDNETGKISKILLEIFNCKNKKLTYITIPARTSFTMSETLYCRLVPVNPTIPQVIKLSGITKYFAKDTVYDYGVLLLEDLLKIKISYYTVIPQSVYDTMFTAQSNVKADNGITSGNSEDASQGKSVSDVRIYPKEIFTVKYTRFLKTLKTADEISNYIEDFYSETRSNLSLSGKMNYVESYSKTSINNISFELIGGSNKNSAYLVDNELAEVQLSEYMAAAAN